MTAPLDGVDLPLAQCIDAEDAQAPPLSVPRAPGPVEVVVENPDGQQDAVPGAYTYS